LVTILVNDHATVFTFVSSTSIIEFRTSAIFKCNFCRNDNVENSPPARAAQAIISACKNFCYSGYAQTRLKRLNSAEIDYHISFGTLLGIVREGDLIAWDDDADIIIHAPHEAQMLSILLILPPSYLLVRGCSGLHRVYDRENNVYMDLFVYERSASGQQLQPVNPIHRIQHALLSRFQKGWNLPSISLSQCLPTRIVQWQDVQIGIPAQPEQYLTTLFGVDWRTPRQD
jgi:hypothetical protein